MRTPSFAGSKRYPALLQYVVEKTLAGDVDSLKERTIGIEVFQRPPNYDTSSDTVVRYTAGEVRKRLALYYHEAGSHDPVQIVLPPGSYAAEFYLVLDEEPIPPVLHPEPPPALEQVMSPVPRAVGARRTRWILAAALLAFAVGAGVLWRKNAASPSFMEQFWEPVVATSHKEPLLVCPGAVTVAPERRTGMAPVDAGTQDALVSAETAGSIGLLTDALGKFNAPYVLRLVPEVPLAQRESRSAILIGAYSNPWTMEAVRQLRYHFTEQPLQSIVDSTEPSVSWSRPVSWSTKPGNDYGLLARVRDSRSGQYKVIVAGLGRTGTAAAAQFVTSASLMNLLSSRVPTRWKSQNLEVVLRKEVRGDSQVDPTIEAVWSW